ncbi:MAG: hypothetical protein APF81_20180 [Desulfosporosinus sp. BRH_c37]|nr:MAG: hypothetical protein APF81_20180 [Desulfosporosinus sp. BRH_c37]
MDQSIEFIKAMREDSELQVKVKQAMEGASDIDAEVAAVTDVAVKAGFNVSQESLKGTVLQAKKAAGELSDDDLANVAGGGTLINGIIAVDKGLDDAIDAVNKGVDYAGNKFADFFSGW